MISREEIDKLRKAKSNWYGELKRTIGIENIKTLEKLINITQQPTLEQLRDTSKEESSINYFNEMKALQRKIDRAIQGLNQVCMEDLELDNKILVSTTLQILKESE